MKITLVLWVLVFLDGGNISSLPVAFHAERDCATEAKKIQAMRVKHGFAPIKWHCESVMEVQ